MAETPRDRQELCKALFDNYAQGTASWWDMILTHVESFGLRIVPVEPTEEMCAAAALHEVKASEAIRKAIAASPFAPEEK